MGLSKLIEYLHITLYILVYDRISAKVSSEELKIKTLLVSYKYLNIEKYLCVIGKYLQIIIIIIRKIKYIWVLLGRISRECQCPIWFDTDSFIFGVSGLRRS